MSGRIHLDLKSGNLLWPSLTAPPHGYSPLTGDLTCEALVVGGGISGAITAWHLARAGIDVAVIDRRAPVAGSTSASTALLQYEIDKPLVELADLLGQPTADRAYRRCRRALHDMAAVVRSLDDDCALAPRSSLYLASDSSDLDLLHNETAARQRIGINVTLLSIVQLQSRFGISRPGAILSTDAMEVDPYRLTLALLRSAAAQGARYHPQTQARLEHLDQHSATLLTPDGARIRARHVIFATGYETPEQFSGWRCTLKSTYAIATAPVDPARFWPGRALIWEHADPYLYVRTTADNRIIVGGEDENLTDPAARDALIAKKSSILCQKFRDLFPAIPITPTHQWAGTFAQTDDGLPFIGAAPNLPNCFFALGYGGNGTTFSLIAAQVICAAILGRADPDADVFAFGRNINPRQNGRIRAAS